MKYEDILKNEEVRAFIRKGNANLRVLGFTDHSEAHTAMVAERAAYILKELGYNEHDIELVKIAGFMHDIGNCINRTRHAEYGALLANELLEHTDMSLEDRVTVVSAIGNHDEGTGVPVNPISAALILADKSDVRRSRVRNDDVATFDIHDRVNYSVESSALSIDSEQKEIRLHLTIDTKISPVMDYFEIFMRRMLLCRKAAETLGLRFRLTINEQNLI
jgi:putative nucleotidyltransferase with HDIG domain